MTKTYTEKEFNDVLTAALMSIVHMAEENCSNSATGIMMTGVLILSEIRGKIFDDDTETITIEKE